MFVCKIECHFILWTGRENLFYSNLLSCLRCYFGSLRGVIRIIFKDIFQIYYLIRYIIQLYKYLWRNCWSFFSEKLHFIVLLMICIQFSYNRSLKDSILISVQHLNHKFYFDISLKVKISALLQNII